MPLDGAVELELNGKVAPVTAGDQATAAMRPNLPERALIFGAQPPNSAKRKDLSDASVTALNTGGPVLSVGGFGAIHCGGSQASGRRDLSANNVNATKPADFFTSTEQHWPDGIALRFHGHVRLTQGTWLDLCAPEDSIPNIVARVFEPVRPGSR